MLHFIQTSTVMPHHSITYSVFTQQASLHIAQIHIASHLRGQLNANDADMAKALLLQYDVITTQAWGNGVNTYLGSVCHGLLVTCCVAAVVGSDDDSSQGYKMVLYQSYQMESERLSVLDQNSYLKYTNKKICKMTDVIISSLILEWEKIKMNTTSIFNSIMSQVILLIIFDLQLLLWIQTNGSQCYYCYIKYNIILKLESIKLVSTHTFSCLSKNITNSEKGIVLAQ